jgi:signal transduction histidine kinase
MPIVESTFALPRDPRLEAQVADHATSAVPAWLWSANGSQILWANAVGAAIFGADPGACTARRFDPKHPAAVEIVRLAATLPQSGQARLERLRGFGGSLGRAITCLCSRVTLDDVEAILLVSTEPAGPPLTLRERVSRLLAHAGKPLIAFTPDGKLLYATPTAQVQFAAIQSASAIDEALFDRALTAGSASGSTPHGAVAIERLGSNVSAVLVADFDPQSGMEYAAESPSRGGLGATKNPGTPSSPELPRETASRRGDELAAERRHPLRFVWQMDTDGRFVVGSDEFMELMGPRTTAAFGRLWSEIAAELKLDPDDRIARAVATRETWSSITVSWPVDDGGERLPVELSGLPVFDRDRLFRGYRGFGVCRDLDRINHLARARRERPIGFMVVSTDAAEPQASVIAAQPQGLTAVDGAGESAAAASPVEIAAEPEVTGSEVAARAEHSSINVPPGANVVPFRTAMQLETKVPALSAIERKAFRELAQELTARLQGVREGLTEQNDSGLPGEETAASEPAAAAPVAVTPALLDCLPLGVLIYRHEETRDAILYANRYLLELSGYQNLEALAALGGLDKLFAEPAADALAEDGSPQPLSIVSRDGMRRPVEGRLVAVPWGRAAALALIVSNGEAEERRRSNALSLQSAQSEIRDLKAHVETFKKTEAEMRAATREAQRAAAAKAEFVAKISHEVRTPLNAITGFAEVIMGERFGPIGNERYREYMKDIYAAGLHVVSVLNDLLDLSKVETGMLDMSFANVSLNELTQQCVGIMQPQASRARIIIRTSLTPGLPQVVADERSLRQIVLNLLSNSIKFTGPGGQVIVSTAFADGGEAVLRVRDTGVGMSEKDVEAALEPFRQTATSGSWGSGGTGLGLPLTKALAEANRAHFSIKSAPNAGTLIEVAFPPTRIAR